MLRNVLLFLLFISLFGLIGHLDYVSEVETSRIDNINKQEVIKDLQLRCYKGELDKDFCKGY